MRFNEWFDQMSIHNFNFRAATTLRDRRTHFSCNDDR